MHKYQKVVASIILIALLVLLSSISAFAESSEYGITASVTTDADTYGLESTVRVHIVVTNTNPFIIKNASIEHFIPAGLKQSKNADLKLTKSLAAGEKIEFDLELVRDVKAKTNASSSSPGTGDRAFIWVYIILALGSAALLAILLAYYRHKTRFMKSLSVFLCFALIASSVPSMAFAADVPIKSFETSKTFRVGEQDYKFRTLITYAEDNAELTAYEYIYESYTTAALGRGGYSMVNDFTGGLTHIFDDISMNGNRLPIEVSHVYTSPSESSIGSTGSMKLGKGWRLSVMEQIVKTGSSEYPYGFVDSDGSIYYFKRALRENGPDIDGNPYELHSFVEKSSKESDPDRISWGFREELGSNNEITGYTMIHPDFSEYFYNADGYLERAIDPHGVADRVYSYAAGKLTKITDPVGRTVTFDYDVDGYLIRMTDPSGRSLAYEYDKSNDALTKVVYPDDKYIRFTYDANSSLSSVTDIDGAKLEYEYSSGRISKLKDRGTEGGLDSSLAFLYGKLETIITDEDGEREVVRFNKDGTVLADGEYLDEEDDSVRSTYSENKDLIKTEEKGKDGSWTVTYEAGYDDKHHVLWETSGGTKTTYTYDAFFNITKRQSEKIVQGASSPIVATYAQGGTLEEWEYTPDGNYPTKYTDATGAITRYNYNLSKGTLLSIVDPNGNLTEFTYDFGTDRVVAITSNGVSNTATFDNDNITSLSAANGTKFDFAYDQFGNQVETKIGANVLASKSYDTKNRVTKTSYGNGQFVEPSYNAAGKRIGIKYNGAEKYIWSYDKTGNLSQAIDLENNVVWSYADDKVMGSNGVMFSRQFKKMNLMALENSYLDGIISSNKFTYNATGLLQSQTIRGNSGQVQDQSTEIEYEYYNQSTLNNLKSKIISNNDVIIGETIYTYVIGWQGSETSRVSKMQNPGTDTSFIYEYDANGNITTIKDASAATVKARYTYDGLNQLVREDNAYADRTYVYEYDNGGNITAKRTYAYTLAALGDVVSTFSYVYGASNLPGWNDVLASFDGKAITYDAIGNPLTYDGYSFTWGNGRQLESIYKDGEVISCKYDGNGIRAQKVVAGVVTDYVVDELSRILQEKTGSDIKTFEYDVDGHLLSMKHDGVVYYYILNLQGDVIGLLDESGEQVAAYSYDAWGNLISKSGAASDINPFGYRGYYQDKETGLYYLQSRYYNSQWGRFLNADEIFDDGVGVLQTNLFAYVANNPIMYSDVDGHFVNLIVGGVAGAVISAVTYFVELWFGLRDLSWWAFAGIVTVGATLGAFGGYVSGLDTLAKLVVKLKILVKPGLINKLKSPFVRTIVKVAAKGAQFVINGFIKSLSRKPGESWLEFARRILGV